MTPQPHILISNDDGVNAPGLAALVQTLAACPDLHVSICGPAEEQSAKSHALTLGRVCVATRIPKIHNAVLDAYAVSGTPADSVMLALSSNILSVRAQYLGRAVYLPALPVSSRRPGGLWNKQGRKLRPAHHLFRDRRRSPRSRHQRAATEGRAAQSQRVALSTQGIPALAVSLDNYAARAPEQYMQAAQCVLPLVKAMAGLLPVPHTVLEGTRGYVLNVNTPGEGPYRGYAWARQGVSCSFSRCETG